jgi:hypothetical protein
MRRRLFTLALVLGLGTGCASLPEPEAGDVKRAQAKWTDVDLAALKNGRHVYVAKCSGCHTLHLPDERSPDEWARIVAEMEHEEEVELSVHEREAIVLYLVTLSGRPRPGAQPL